MKVYFGELYFAYGSRAYIQLPYRWPNLDGLVLPKGIAVYIEDGESGIHEMIYNPFRRGVGVVYSGKKRGGWLAKLRKAARLVAAAPESNKNQAWRARARCERRGIWQVEGD